MRETSSAAGGIIARATGSATGNYSNSGIVIENDGDITAGAQHCGIYVTTFGSATGAHSNAGIDINNAGDIRRWQHRH